jgi:hypothetical protein
MDANQQPHPLIEAILEARDQIRAYRYYLVDNPERIDLLLALQQLLREGSYHLDAQEVTWQSMVDTATDPLATIFSKDGTVSVELAICGAIERRIAELRDDQEHQADATGSHD